MSRLAIALLSALAFRASAASIAVEVRDASGAPVADAVVYATPMQGGADSKGTGSASIEQIDREFVPYVSVIQAGTSVAFPNRDPILHHVYSFSPAKSFEIKLYTGKSPGHIVFDKPGLVTLGRNIHDWMIGYILVVATPHFAKTGPSGNALLRDLPEGGYELNAWHPQQRAALPAYRVALDSGVVKRASFVFDIHARKAPYKPPLDRSRY
ncbi:MAG: methylamine utilization protein [Usitatibacter sp.]